MLVLRAPDESSTLSVTQPVKGKSAMKSKALPQFPHGLLSKFDVVSQQGETGSKTWVLRDMNSQLEYELSPATIEGWDIPAAPSKGPSIIVALKPSMVAMHLPTGEFYRDAPPPSRFRLKR